MVMEAATVRAINKNSRACRATTFTLRQFRYLRTVVFVLSALYAAYTADIATLIAEDTPLETGILLFIKAVLIPVAVPIVTAYVYLPILRLVRWCTDKKNLLDPSVVGQPVSQNIYKKLSALKEDRHELFVFGINTDRHRYIKIPLALACGVLMVVVSVLALPKSDLAIGNFAPYSTGWCIAVGAFALLFGAVSYPVLALFYKITDAVILFPYTRYTPSQKTDKQVEPYLKEWEKQERNRKESERKAKQYEKEQKEKKRLAEERKRAVEARNRQLEEGERLYQKAVACDPWDEQTLEQAARYRYPKACIYFGRKMIDEQERNDCDEAKKQRCLKRALDYLSVFENEYDTVGTFLYLFARTLHDDHHDANRWNVLLNRARRIQKSGELPQEYVEPCDDLVERLEYEVEWAEDLARPAPAAWGAEDYARIAARAQEILSGGSRSGSSALDDDMDTMQRIQRNLHTPGYDPDGFGPSSDL